MPRLPIPPVGEDYDKNRQEQYEALGRFVEAFEGLVDTFRSSCLLILRRDEEHAKLVNILLHHSAMTAKPLFEIMRALIVDFLSQQTKVTAKERESVSSLLKLIATECQNLWETRNGMLHGTWKVGYLSWDDPNATKFILDKYKPTATGLRREDSLPDDAPSLLALGDRCYKASNWIAILCDCLPLSEHQEDFADTFKFEKGKWYLTYRRTIPETLP